MRSNAFVQSRAVSAPRPSRSCLSQLAFRLLSRLFLPSTAPRATRVHLFPHMDPMPSRAPEVSVLYDEIALSSLSRAQLQSLCKGLSLKAGGKVCVLIYRVLASCSPPSRPRAERAHVERTRTHADVRPVPFRQNVDLVQRLQEYGQVLLNPPTPAEIADESWAVLSEPEDDALAAGASAMGEFGLRGKAARGLRAL